MKIGERDAWREGMTVEENERRIEGEGAWEDRHGERRWSAVNEREAKEKETCKEDRG